MNNAGKASINLDHVDRAAIVTKPVSIKMPPVVAPRREPPAAGPQQQVQPGPAKKPG